MTTTERETALRTAVSGHTPPETAQRRPARGRAREDTAPETAPSTLTHRDHRQVWTEAQHQVADLIRDAAFAAGYATGYRDAEQALQEWAQEFAASAPGARVAPLEQQAARLVRDLVVRMTAECRPAPAPEVRYDDPRWPEVTPPGGAA